MHELGRLPWYAESILIVVMRMRQSGQSYSRVWNDVAIAHGLREGPIEDPAMSCLVQSAASLFGGTPALPDGLTMRGCADLLMDFIAGLSD